MKNFFRLFYSLFLIAILFNSCSNKKEGALSEIYNSAKDDIAAIGKLNEELIKAQTERRYADVKNLIDEMNLKRAETQDRLNKLISEKNAITIPFDQLNKNYLFEIKEIKVVGVIWNSNLNPNLLFSAAVLLKDTLRNSFFGRWDFIDSENKVVDNPAFYSPTKLIGTPAGEIVELKSNTTFSKIADFQKFVLR